MRASVLLSLLFLGLFATAVLGVDNIAQGNSCGNMDTCASGNSCYSNKCAPTQSGLDNGLGNDCSATDCCQGSLVCNKDTSKCAPSVSFLSSITCTAGSTASGPQTDLPSGANCGNMDTCASGLSCYNNVCTDSQSGVDNGAGNDCSATDCCPGSLVCNSALNKCAVSVPGLSTTSCSSTSGGTTSGGLAAGAKCGNTDTCASGLSCYNNACATTVSDLDNGAGNDCSATDCCPGSLVCNSAINKCAPAVGGLGTVTCSATTGGTSGGTTTGGLASGASCTNSDTCATGLSCYKNVCSTTVSGQSNGFGNTCSATDCCGTGLQCDTTSLTCVVANSGSTGLTCTNTGSGTPTTVDQGGASTLSASMLLIALLAAAAGML